MFSNKLIPKFLKSSKQKNKTESSTNEEQNYNIIWVADNVNNSENKVTQSKLNDLGIRKMYALM